jgi:hypothetical protein
MLSSKAISVNRQSQAGSVMVEFALLTPILVSLFLGVIFYGYDFYTYNRLEEVTRGGARFASALDYDVLNSKDPPVTNCVKCSMALNKSNSDLALRTVNFAVYGDPAGGTQPIIEGLTTANVAVSMDILNGAPAAMWVSIKNYSMRTPGGTITLNKPSTVFPYVGNYKVSP